eukprot:TRINITY_DN8150_c0_g1_i1.p1 TRINITY_DN8150_c0_g1~~TRINITY_DN8150_c0_g1_i1.p1  ORF type:complete len:850 (+),score=167.59 TRINITY_DN8150_c0_g1_i1:1152-3701(+)
MLETHSLLRQHMIRAFPVVLCDAEGRLNFAARVSASALAELKREAVLTLAALTNEKVDPFRSVFMTRVDFSAKYDCHVRFAVGTAHAGDAPVVPPVFLDEDSWRREEARAEQLLQKGLTERVQLIRVVRRQLPQSWTIDKRLPLQEPAPISIGLLLSDPDVAFRLTDKGPSADDKAQALKFRAFWGPKAELRRFRDGTIVETAVWDCPHHKRHLIIGQLVSHVLQRHMGAGSESGDVQVTGGQLDFALMENGRDPIEDGPALQDAYTKLSAALRELKDLPLTIVGVQPLSEALTQTAVFPPRPHPLAGAEEAPREPGGARVPACVEPLEIAVQLEGSGKWPDDPAAVLKTKLAFCLAAAKRLRADHGVDVRASEDAVDVLFAGFAFRLVVAYERDATYLMPTAAQMAGPDTGSAGPTTGHSRPRPAGGPEKDALLRAVHSSFMQGLQGRHPAFSPAVRLAKRWLAVHLLSPALSSPAVELLVASLFCQSPPFAPPRMRVVAFLRFLRLLASHDWLAAPLVVDVNNDLSSAQHRAIEDHFHSLRRDSEEKGSAAQSGNREAEGVPSMYIATPYDQKSSVWTMGAPSPEGLKRLVAFSKSSADLLTRLIADGGDSWQSLFCTPLGGYGAVILLCEAALPHPDRVLFPARQSLALLAGTREATFNGESKLRGRAGPVVGWIPRDTLRRGADGARAALLVGFNPIARLVLHLRALYGPVANFWYDAVGGDAIGVEWRLSGSSATAGGGGDGLAPGLGGAQSGPYLRFLVPAERGALAEGGSKKSSTKRKAAASLGVLEAENPALPALQLNTDAFVDDVLVLAPGLVEQVHLPTPRSRSSSTLSKKGAPKRAKR